MPTKVQQFRQSLAKDRGLLQAAMEEESDSQSQVIENN